MSIPEPIRPIETRYEGYRGKDAVGGKNVFVRDPGAGDSSLKHTCRHSPDGPQWGYGGSGPADLALSILVDAFGTKVADKYYQSFKWEFVAGWKDNWSITIKEIINWMKTVP